MTDSLYRLAHRETLKRCGSSTLEHERAFFIATACLNVHRDENPEVIPLYLVLFPYHVPRLQGVHLARIMKSKEYAGIVTGSVVGT